MKKETLLKLKEKHNIQFPLLIDNTAELSEQLKISAIPTLVFYHPSKKIKFKEGLCELKELNKIISQELQVN